MEREVIKLYHATLKDSAISMTKSQEFICNERNANNEFLGRGAYFYKTRQEAVEWTLKMYKDKYGHYPNNYDDIFKNYRIVVADIEYSKNEVLDLDERENIRKIREIAKIVSDKLNLDLLQGKYNSLAVLLNYLETENYIQGINIVERTFPFHMQLEEIFKSINVLNKKVICVKNTNIIKKMNIDKKITKKEYEDGKYFLNGG